MGLATGLLLVGRRVLERWPLKETRDRVGTLVSAAAVVAGLAAALASNSGRITRLTAWGIVATVGAAFGFGAIAVAAVIIWRPFPGTFTLDAGMMVGSYVEGDPAASLPEIPRELACISALTALTTVTCPTAG